MVSTIFVWLTSSCQPVSPKLQLGQPVIVSADFQTQPLNEQVLVSTNLSPKDLTRPDLKTWIAQKTTKVSRKKDAILLGSFRRYPRAWFYTRVVNTSNTSRQLVVDEFNRIRCDYFEVFTSQHGFVKSWGRIGRATPFSGYPLPFLTYAVPFTIPPKDTLTLIVHTQRHYGAHEVNLTISTYENYLSEHTVLFLSKVFESVVLVICALVMFIVGWIYRYRTMTYLSCYLLSVVYVKLNYLGFTDAFTNFTEIGLSGTNANVFALFVSCIVFHPFWMEWMKVVPKNEKVFVLISYAMMGFSLLCVCCYLLPIRLFNTVYAVIDLSLLMLIACLLTLLWMFYCSLIALLRVKIYYMFIVIIVIFLPWLLQQLSSVLDKSPYILTYISPLTFIVTPVGLSITSAFLLRQQLISRRKHEANLNHIKESLEEIRKTEIETIGRNLHDNVGNMLASLQGYLSLKNQNQEVIKNLVTESMHEVRFLSHNLIKQDNQPIVEKPEMPVSRFHLISPHYSILFQ